MTSQRDPIAIRLSKLNKPEDLKGLLSFYPLCIDDTDVSGCTALMFSAAYGYLDCLRVLLRAGAGRNIRDKRGRTALFWASGWGCSKSVEILLRNGANHTIADHDGVLPLSDSCLSRWCHSPISNKEILRLKNLPQLIKFEWEHWSRRGDFLKFCFGCGFLERFWNNPTSAREYIGGDSIIDEIEHGSGDATRIEELLRIVICTQSLFQKVMKHL